MNAQKEIRKFKLKYEIMARNELNQKLSEINEFLEKRATDEAVNEKKKDEVVDKIQKDLGDRLLKSRADLAAIKEQMKGKERLLNRFFSFFRRYAPIILCYRY